jgi:hypothetical protein
VFIPLFAAGIETIEPAPGTAGGYGAGIIHANYTHSLVGAAILSLVFGAGFGWRWGRRAGIVLGLVAFSHWLLDLVVHRADLPILPGNAGGLPTLGFGAWRYPALSIVMELALVVAGAALYWRAARSVAAPTGQTRRADLAGGVVLASGLLVLWLDVSGLAG